MAHGPPQDVLVLRSSCTSFVVPSLPVERVAHSSLLIHSFTITVSLSFRFLSYPCACHEDIFFRLYHRLLSSCRKRLDSSRPVLRGLQSGPPLLTCVPILEVILSALEGHSRRDEIVVGQTGRNLWPLVCRRRRRTTGG